MTQVRRHARWPGSWGGQLPIPFSGSQALPSWLLPREARAVHLRKQITTSPTTFSEFAHNSLATHQKVGRNPGQESCTVAHPPTSQALFLFGCCSHACEKRAAYPTIVFQARLARRQPLWTVVITDSKWCISDSGCWQATGLNPFVDAKPPS